MYIDYKSVIQEEVAELEEREKKARGSKAEDRFRMLRLLKTEFLYTFDECASFLGYSERQMKRWWKVYREQGIEKLGEPASYSGMPPRLTEEAWKALEGKMCAGQIGSVKDAQIFLREQWGIVYASESALGKQLHRHHATLKTGRRQHRKANQEQQALVKKTSES